MPDELAAPDWHRSSAHNARKTQVQAVAELADMSRLARDEFETHKHLCIACSERPSGLIVRCPKGHHLEAAWNRAFACHALLKKSLDAAQRPTEVATR